MSFDASWIDSLGSYQLRKRSVGIVNFRTHPPISNRMRHSKKTARQPFFALFIHHFSINRYTKITFVYPKQNEKKKRSTQRSNFIAASPSSLSGHTATLSTCDFTYIRAIQRILPRTWTRRKKKNLNKQSSKWTQILQRTKDKKILKTFNLCVCLMAMLNGKTNARRKHCNLHWPPEQSSRQHNRRRLSLNEPEANKKKIR